MASIVRICLALLLALSATLVASSCGGSTEHAESGSLSPGPSVSLSPSTSPSPTSSSLSGEDLRFSQLSVSELRHELKSTFARDPHALFRDGVRAAPSDAIAALKEYFASVDPDAFISGASQVAFVWAFKPDCPRSTSTRLYLVVFFEARGDKMIAAGSIAPGYNAHLFLLTRQSREDAWHVDGLFYP